MADKRRRLEYGEPPPRLPTQDDLVAGRAPSVADFFGKLIPFTRLKLTEKFAKNVDAGGHGLSQPLHELPPLPITSANGQLRNFKEPWNMSNCGVAMSSTRLYEASGNVFWFKVDPVARWAGEELAVLMPSWTQIFRSRSNWSVEAFVASSEEDCRSNFRRMCARCGCISRWLGGVD